MTGLDLLFRPRAVAVIGASRDRRSVGGSILHNLLTFEFQGQVFPVNPRASVVHSLKCYPSVEDIPDPVDLAVIAVPRPHVLAALESCGRKGIGAVVLITAGFKETGEAGRALELDVVRMARQFGIRLVGPNCMGIINMDPDVRLQASFSANEPLPGPVAFSSQSGALGEAILALLRERALGLSMFVSLGNKADVSGNDLLEYWEQDPRTSLVLMYLESFGNPKRFLEICQRVSRTSPSSPSSRAGPRPAHAPRPRTPVRWRAPTTPSTPSSRRAASFVRPASRSSSSSPPPLPASPSRAGRASRSSPTRAGPASSPRMRASSRAWTFPRSRRTRSGGFGRRSPRKPVW
ncbi:MAG: CoA-binding protein [Vicinamibacterales bacterium]